jgi:ubiquitin C-terminal hydrolase
LPGASLQEIVDGYRTALDEEFSSGNEWKIEEEMGEIQVSHYKETQKIISSAPEILVVRVNNYVVKPEQDQMINFSALFKELSENHYYKLVGFSQNHHQTHWTSVVWKESNWHYCNDSETKLISAEDPLFKHPANYMIFQKHVNENK